MNKFYLLLVLAGLVACQQKTKKTATADTQATPETIEVANKYPENMASVFEAHGGLALWKDQRTLSYVMPKGDRPETHTIDLWSRWDRIDIEDVSMGYDGQTWLLDPKEIYKGNPEFYHNLMFYFYAMPFVLADSGINYGETEALEFEGQTYPGIQITYDSGIGTSPKDEYYVHYNPETFQMEWLGYTVTYRTGEDSDNIKWIRYNDWTTIDGLTLPKSISWYNYEGRQIQDLRNTVVFENIKLSKDAYAKSFYQKPAKASYFTRPE